MSVLRNLVERRGADPAEPWGDSTPPSPGSIAPTMAGIRVTDDVAMQVITVFACVSIIADGIATLPIAEYTNDSAGVLRKVETETEFLAQPFHEITLQDWLSQLVVSILLRGNSYGLITSYGRLMVPDQIFPLHPDQVAVTRNRSTGRREYRVNNQLQAPGAVVHVPGLTIPGQLTGLNPIQAARGGIALAKATEHYGAKFFDNAAEARGILSTDTDLDTEQTKKLARSWIVAHQGPDRAHLPAVLSGGVKWTSITINPDDAQFLQTREFQRHEIAMLFRIPEHMIGVQDKTSSWGTGIEQMEIGFVMNTLLPWMRRFEAALSALLPPGRSVKFDLTGRLRGDTPQRYAAYQIALNNGWMCVDDVRQLEGLPPLPDGQGQVYRQSVQSAPIDGIFPAVPAPTPEAK